MTDAGYGMRDYPILTKHNSVPTINKTYNKMKFIVEKSLKDFDFWSGACDFASKLTDDQFDLIEQYLEGTKEDDCFTDTEINDLFWFEQEFLYNALPIEDVCHIVLDDGDNQERYDLVERFTDEYYNLNHLDYTDSDIKDAWNEWLEEVSKETAKEIIDADIEAREIEVDDDQSEWIEEWVDDWMFESKLDLSDGEDLFKEALKKAWDENRDSVLNPE